MTRKNSKFLLVNVNEVYYSKCSDWLLILMRCQVVVNWKSWGVSTRETCSVFMVLIYKYFFISCFSDIPNNPWVWRRINTRRYSPKQM